MTKPVAMITGASSGIGQACARRLADSHQLVICGRRRQRLEELTQELSNKTTVICLDFDIQQKEDVSRAVEALGQVHSELHVLINNAGNAFGLSPFQDGDIADWEAMIDTNVKGVLYTTKSVLPLLMKADAATIINLGSVAGKSVYPQGNVYCATKFAVNAISEALRQDLLGKNIRITCINPGLVETEFSEVRFKGDKSRAKAVYENMQPLSAEDVADIANFIVSQPAHVNISDLTVYPTQQATPTMVARN